MNDQAKKWSWNRAKAEKEGLEKFYRLKAFFDKQKKQSTK